jgi:hypothetical protein
MATITPQISLLKEFQSLLEIVTNGEAFTCRGITKKGVKCERQIGSAAKDKLLALIFKIIEFLEKGRGDIKSLLYKGIFSGNVRPKSPRSGNE